MLYEERDFIGQRFHDGHIGFLFGEHPLSYNRLVIGKRQEGGAFCAGRIPVVQDLKTFSTFNRTKPVFKRIVGPGYGVVLCLQVN